MITHEPQVFYSSLQSHTPIIAIDYGRKKLGIAVSDHLQQMSLPLATETVLKNDHISIILKYLTKYKTSHLVIGLPINMDGSNSEQTMAITRFAEALSAKHPEISILMQDERLTSKNAESLLRLGGTKRKQRHDIDDSVAASLILDSALQRRNHS